MGYTAPREKKSRDNCFGAEITVDRVFTIALMITADDTSSGTVALQVIPAARENALF